MHMKTKFTYPIFCFIISAFIVAPYGGFAQSSTQLTKQLINDPFFTKGFFFRDRTTAKLTDTKIVRNANDIPMWTLGEWISKKSIGDVNDPDRIVEDFQNGYIKFSNKYKSICFGNGNLPSGFDYRLSMKVNSIEEFDSTFKTCYQRWPAFYASQRLSLPKLKTESGVELTINNQCPPLSLLTALNFQIQAKMDMDPNRHISITEPTCASLGCNLCPSSNSNQCSQSCYVPVWHISHFLLNFMVQNLNPSSLDYGKSVSLMLRIYDSRHTGQMPDNPIRVVDVGESGLMCLMDYDIYANPDNANTSSGNWETFSLDVLPLTDQFLNIAYSSDHFLSQSINLDDYRIASIQFGWEITGLRIDEIFLKGLSLNATQKLNGIALTKGKDVLCRGDEVNFAAAEVVAGTTYTWSLKGPNSYSETLSSTTNTCSYVIPSGMIAGTYTVGYTVKSNAIVPAITYIASKTISIQPSDKVDAPLIVGATAVCAGQAITLKAQPANYNTYEWTGPMSSFFQSVSTNPCIYRSNASDVMDGTYKLQVKNQYGCSSPLVNTNVAVIAAPLSDITLNAKHVSTDLLGVKIELMNLASKVKDKNIIASNWIRIKSGSTLGLNTIAKINSNPCTAIPLQCSSSARVMQNNSTADEELKEKETSLSDIILIPNPNDGNFTLALRTSNESGNSAEIYIYNYMGQLIHSQKENSLPVQINLSSQPSGIYTVKVKVTEPNESFQDREIMHTSRLIINK